MEARKKLSSPYTTVKCSVQSSILKKRNSNFGQPFLQKYYFLALYQCGIIYLVLLERCQSLKQNSSGFYSLPVVECCGAVEDQAEEMQKHKYAHYVRLKDKLARNIAGLPEAPLCNSVLAGKAGPIPSKEGKCFS